MKPLTPWFRKQTPAVRREPEYPLYSLQREMNSLFQDFFKNFELGSFNYDEDAFGDFSPRVDMNETEKEFRVTAELPGMEEKDVQIKLAGDVLTISGEKHNEKVEDVKGHYRMERVYGSFSRSLLLPTEVELEKSTATFKNGVLTVVLPKTPDTEKKTKSIPIKAC
ncbi:MAG TPA: Hsp20/alpha crystallin family protein [Candidatus Melainabacteria bacterium]|jgi:HSP20 family protein|nr:Hsp20/alpha crystallin family protein [Candidatus Melainabacteria bacterium]HIN63159.1 Hsp20/alpha crystallin family protein [Candidatus Obscuribacterales bacterium]